MIEHLTRNYPAKKILKLWLWLLLLVSIAANIYIYSTPGGREAFSENPPLLYGLIVAVFVIFASCPILLAMFRRAKTDGTNLIRLFAGSMLFQHGIWLIFFIINLLTGNIR